LKFIRYLKQVIIFFILHLDFVLLRFLACSESGDTEENKTKENFLCYVRES